MAPAFLLCQWQMWNKCDEISATSAYDFMYISGSLSGTPACSEIPPERNSVLLLVSAEKGKKPKKCAQTNNDGALCSFNMFTHFGNSKHQFWRKGKAKELERPMRTRMWESTPQRPLNGRVYVYVHAHFSAYQKEKKRHLDKLYKQSINRMVYAHARAQSPL